MLNKKALAASVSAGPAKYVEDVFSTYLYTGNGTFSGETQAISNGIDLAGEGGMVWIKNRTSASTDNCVSDTVRGGTSNMIRTNSTATATGSGSNISFQSTGFTCLTSGTNTNYTGENYCSWTFRKTKKFFDIVTWTGTGSAMTINHNLGSAPGMIIMKKVNGSPGTGNWAVWHRGLPTESGSQQYESNVLLNLTDANVAYGYLTATPTSSSFSVSSSFGQASDYVAYLFAHDAGGFGTAGTDNVISCGSFTGSSLTTVTLGYEPQYVMLKYISADEEWIVADVMRGMSLTTDKYLAPNSSNAEATYDFIEPTATGFIVKGLNTSGTYIYMAIRRPMKVPTTGTSVFLPTTYTGNGATGQTITTDFPVDFSLFINRTKINSDNNVVFDRLRGGTKELATNTTDAEGTLGSTICPLYDSNTGVKLQGGTVINASGGSFIVENFRRASGFFDVVCYTGTGSATTQTHNLGVVPEMYIVKRRSGSTASWFVYHKDLNGGSSPQGYFINLNSSGGETNNTGTWNNTAPTSSVFSLGSASAINGSSQTYVAYLFASCPGVSKVGSYTGNGGSSQDIDCGFTAGARFVLIKRTDSTGDWWVWDTARGMVSGTDPRLALNSTAAESNANWVYTTTGGFQIVTSDATINASGGSYIFLSIA